MGVVDEEFGVENAKDSIFEAFTAKSLAVVGAVRPMKRRSSTSSVRALAGETH